MTTFSNWMDRIFDEVVNQNGELLITAPKLKEKAGKKIKVK